MARILLAEVQSWLEQTKLLIDSFDDELEETASDIALGSLSQVYDVTTWVDDGTTPSLVRKAIAMLVAAWTYNRQYSEEDPNGSAYAAWLEAKAYALLESIRSGAIDLPEVAGLPTSSGNPAFWPDDTTGATEVYDDQGYLVGIAGSDAAKFRMSTKW